MPTKIQQHEHDQRAGDLPGVDRHPLHGKWENDRRVADCHHHRQHHGADRQRDIARGHLGQLEQEWRPSAAAVDDEGGGRRLLHGQEPRGSDGHRRSDNEVADQQERDDPEVTEGSGGYGRP